MGTNLLAITFWQLYFLDMMLIVVVLPGLIFGMWAQGRVSRAYAEYKQVFSSSGLTAFAMTRKVLDRAGLQNVAIEQTGKKMGDHYNPRTRTVALSDPNSTSISSLGIAAHEIGHALQHRDKYVPLTIRRIMVPITNISSFMLFCRLFFLLLRLRLGG